MATLLCVVVLSASSEAATMADFVSSTREAAVRSGLIARAQGMSEQLESNLAIIEASGIDPLSVKEVAAGLHRPGLMALSRQNSLEYLLGPPTGDEHVRLQAAVDRIRQIANEHIYESLVEAVGDEAANELFLPLTEYHRAILSESLEHDLKKMRRFEKKFGPRAPKLNAVEVVVNLVAQRLPGFYPTEEEGPGPLEIVASYEPAFLTLVDEELELISTVEFGIRYYLLGDGWGEDYGLTGMLKPGYFSLGVLVASEEDGTLLWPLDDPNPRVGGFVSWGAVKLGYLGGDEARFVVSREFEAIPWLF